jgi:hypothetical protein
MLRAVEANTVSGQSRVVGTGWGFRGKRIARHAVSSLFPQTGSSTTSPEFSTFLIPVPSYPSAVLRTEARPHLSSQSNHRHPLILRHKDNLAPRTAVTVPAVSPLGGREQRHSIPRLLLRRSGLGQLLLPRRRREGPHPPERLGVVRQRQVEGGGQG